MVDIPSSAQQLTQALAQLQKTAANSDLAKLGVEVLVRYISSNQVQISQSHQGRNQSPLLLQLPHHSQTPLRLDGKYQASISQQQGQAVLSLFSDNAESNATYSLNQQQTKQLLSLPAKTLFTSQTKPLSAVQAVIARVLPNRIEVSFNLHGQQHRAQLAIDNPQSFSAGQRVSVQLVPMGNDYQVKLLNQAKPTNTPAQAAPASPPVTSKISAQTAQSVISQLSAAQAATLLQASLNADGNARLKLDTAALPAAIAKLPLQQQQALLPILQKNLAAVSVDVKLNSNGSAQVHLLDTKSPTLLHIPIQSKQVEQLTGLKIPLVDTQKASQVLQQSNLPRQAQHNANVLAGQTELTTADRIPNNQAANIAPLPELSPKSLIHIQNLIRQRLSMAESPSVGLHKIEAGLADPQLTKSPELKQLISELQPKLAQLRPQGDAQDASRIQQLISAPVNNISAPALTSPAQANNLVNGLITVLQLALSARVARNSSAAFERVQGAIMQFLPSMATQAAPQTGRRILQDFSQLEQKHQLLREIGRLLAGHQMNKLSSAEQTAQGQETLYYVLPNAMGGSNKDIELLIKREPHKQGSEKQTSAANKVWNLTMKLSIGDLGELLSKAKLQETSLELSIYASNEKLKVTVMEHLPLLKKRFEQLGISVDKSNCQLGRIPASLQQRPYHIFQTQA